MHVTLITTINSFIYIIQVLDLLHTLYETYGLHKLLVNFYMHINTIVI